MAARKQAEDEAKVEESKAEESKADEQADAKVDDRADGPISLGVDSEKKAEDAGLTLTKDIQVSGLLFTRLCYKCHDLLSL